MYVCVVALSLAYGEDNGTATFETSVNEHDVIPHTPICESQHMTEQIGLHYGGRREDHPNTIISIPGRDVAGVMP